MKLNLEDRRKFRVRIDTKLEDVEFDPNHRIKIKDMDKLEALLFDYKYDKKGRKYKQLACIGHNLCKLDLSEVDFSNVSYNSPFPACLKNTNVKIDFAESYEYKTEGEINVFNVDFQNVDLSNNDFDKLTNDVECTAQFSCCDLRGTNIFVGLTAMMAFINCDLSNIDLNDYTAHIEGSEAETKRLIIADDCYNLLFNGCNLSSTGIRISGVTPDFTEEDREALNLAIARRQLDKCILVEVKNGGVKVEHPIKSKRQNISQKSRLLKEYQTFVSNEINETLDMIDKELQTSKGGRADIDGKHTDETEKKTKKKVLANDFQKNINKYLEEDINE